MVTQVIILTAIVETSLENYSGEIKKSLKRVIHRPGNTSKMYLHHMKYLLLIFIVPVSITVQGQLITDSVLIEQHYRSFSYYQPSAFIKDGSLLFVMHGSGSRGEDIRKHTTQLEAIAGKEK